MMRICTFVVLTWTASTQVAAQPLGRLFFTPAERAALDASRGQKQVPRKLVSDKALEAPPTPQIITFDGLVRRSDGKSTVWLNHRALTERDMLADRRVVGHIRADGALTLQVPQTGASVDLKVGQRVELLPGRNIAPSTSTKANGAQTGHTPERVQGESAQAKSAPSHAQ